MPTNNDPFMGKPTVVMLVEIPLEVYNTLEEGYNVGIKSGLHNHTLEKWSGLLICKGIQSIYDDQKRLQESTSWSVNFTPNDDFVDWLQDQIKMNEMTNTTTGMFYDPKIAKLRSECNLTTLRAVLSKYVSYGRL